MSKEHPTDNFPSPTPHSISPDTHILFLASWYPNDIEPQNGNFIQRHAEAVSRYAQVSVLHIVTDLEATETRYTQHTHQGILEIVGYMPRVPSRHPIRKWKQYLKTYQEAYQQILALRGAPKVIHLNVTFPAGLFACWLKRTYHIPIVLTEHWTSYLESSPYRFNAQERLTIFALAKMLDVNCPVSEDLGKAMVKHGFSSHFEVIPNVVDTDLFLPKAEKASSPTRLIHVSTLEDGHKNVSGILRAFRKLLNQYPELRLTLIGNGYVDQHYSYANELGIPQSKIQIFGEQPIEEVARQMATHDVFVLFSNYENLPCVISEAHSGGLPVISTNVGGIDEMINTSNGLLIAAKDEEALLHAFQKLYENWDAYDLTAIAKQARNRYSYDAVAQKYLNIYRKLIAPP